MESQNNRSLLIPENVIRYLQRQDGRELFKLIVETWGLVKRKDRTKPISRQSLASKRKEFVEGRMKLKDHQILQYYLEPAADRYFMYYETVPKDEYEVDTMPF